MTNHAGRPQIQLFAGQSDNHDGTFGIWPT